VAPPNVVAISTRTRYNSSYRSFNCVLLIPLPCHLPIIHPLCTARRFCIVYISGLLIVLHFCRNSNLRSMASVRYTDKLYQIPCNSTTTGSNLQKTDGLDVKTVKDSSTRLFFIQLLILPHASCTRHSWPLRPQALGPSMSDLRTKVLSWASRASVPCYFHIESLRLVSTCRLRKLTINICHQLILRHDHHHGASCNRPVNSMMSAPLKKSG